MDQIKVIIVQRIFSSYNKPVFDELNLKYKLKLLHAKDLNGVKQTSSSYSILIPFFRYYKKKTSLFLNTFSSIYKIRPKVVIHENSIGVLSLFPTILFCKLLRIKIILWGHGFDTMKGFFPEKSISDKLRIFFMKISDAVLFYGNEGKKILSDYIPEEKLFIAPNTLDTRALLRIKMDLENEGKINIKKRISFEKKFNLIFIGRLLKTKSPGQVLEVFELIRSRLDNNICIHFVGDGEMREEIELLIKQNDYSDYIKLHGALFDEVKTGELLFCSDLMIMPGYVGLSVNHAFCFNCPVVTFDHHFHSPEVEYVIPNKTGYIAKENDLKDMSDWIVDYLLDPKLKEEFSLQIDYILKNVCSIENMAAGFDKAINYTLR